MEVVKAKEADFDAIYNIIVECTRWLNMKDINQWRNVYPIQRFRNDIEKGNVYKFINIGEVIGTVTLNNKKPDYYPEDIFDCKSNVWYMTRLAVSRNKKLRGMGSIFIELVEESALNKKVDSLRLDITKMNPFLEKYYQNLSFKNISEAKIFGESTLFMEKNIPIQNFHNR